MHRLHAVVHGRVQGVGFRYFVMREARALGLSGWVRNQADGSVEVEAEGAAILSTCWWSGCDVARPGRGSRGSRRHGVRGRRFTTAST
jgi:hypothetical protein